MTELRKGAREGVPICAGYLAVSFALGVQARAGGLTPFQAGLMSLMNLTSAGEMAGITVIREAGPFLEMAFVQLVINLRYLLMSAAMSQKLDDDMKFRHRFFMAYGVTDEIFALSFRRPCNIRPYYQYGMTAVAALGWVTGTVIGTVSGGVLPGRIVSALGICLYAMFIAATVPSAKKEKTVALAMTASTALSVLLEAIPFFRGISQGIRIIIVTLAVSALFAAVCPVKEEGV